MSLEPGEAWSPRSIKQLSLRPPTIKLKGVRPSTVESTFEGSLHPNSKAQGPSSWLAVSLPTTRLLGHVGALGTFGQPFKGAQMDDPLFDEAKSGRNEGQWIL